MSTKAKMTLLASIAATTGMIVFVHLNQIEERDLLRQGVVKDIERQEKKRMNVVEQEQQLELRKALEAEEAERLGQSKK
eukprot:m.208427 g.208427  ORF g.208427 m.208427 type:complete len:79 (+) comp13764_c5_seq1:33-269(+)